MVLREQTNTSSKASACEAVWFYILLVALWITYSGLVSAYKPFQSAMTEEVHRLLKFLLAFGVPILGLWYRHPSLVSFTKEVFLPIPCRARHLILGGFAAYLLLFLWDLHYLESEDPFPVSDSVFSLIIVTISAITIGPFLEELFYTGYLFPLLRKDIGIKGAFVGIGIMDVLMHGGDLVASIGQFIIRILLLWVYLKSNWGTAILFHAAINAGVI